MTRRCELTGKGPKSGNNRPFSLKATKRRFLPNIQTKVVRDPTTGKMRRMKLCTQAIRTLKKWEREAEAEKAAAKA